MRSEYEAVEEACFQFQLLIDELEDIMTSCQDASKGCLGDPTPGLSSEAFLTRILDVIERPATQSLLDAMASAPFDGMYRPDDLARLAREGLPLEREVMAYVKDLLTRCDGGESTRASIASVDYEWLAEKLRELISLMSTLLREARRNVDILERVEDAPEDIFAELDMEGMLDTPGFPVGIAMPRGASENQEITESTPAPAPAPRMPSGGTPCPSCGSQVEADLMFCPFCGTPLRSSSSGSYAPAASAPSSGYGASAPQAPAHHMSAPSSSQHHESVGNASGRDLDARPAPGASPRKKGFGIGKLAGLLFRKRASDAPPKGAQVAPPHPSVPEEPPAAADAPRPLISNVRFSAIAPKGLVPATYATVDVVMYENGWEDIVSEVVSEHGEAVGSTSSGWLQVAERMTVSVELTSPELGALGVQEGVWTGRSMRFSFPFAVPAGLAASQVLLVANVSFDGVLATRLSIIATVGSSTKQVMGAVRNDVHSAFISYSSADRARVATIVQGMQAARPDLDVFFDVESLRTGEDWRQSLMNEIDSRDVLYLCWSQNAMSSKWVDFEWRYALEKHGLASIEPVAIDPPELCQPPAELSSKHFNNRLLYIINASCS